MLTFQEWKAMKAASVPELTENGKSLHRYYMAYCDGLRP
jgi:hypothetical protein